MRTRTVVAMVAKREIKTRMLTKANIISMAVMLTVILVGALVGNYFLHRDSQSVASQVAIDQSVSDLRPALEAAGEQQGVELEVTIMTADDARQALTAESGGDQQVTAFLSGEPASPQMLVEQQADPDILAVVTAAVQSYVVTEQITDLRGDPAAFERAVADGVPHLDTLRPADDDKVDGPALGVAMAMIAVLFASLISSGTMIAMGVVEEKTSRVVEILLAAIRPSQLLAGKILGVGVYGLVQVVVLGGALALALVSLGLTGDLDVNIGAALVWLIAWFLLGYTVFALLFGGFAALVSRQEEVGSVTTPLMFLLFVPFYTTMFLVTEDPDGTVVRIMSQIPFFAPFMMPVRDAFGALEPWEMPLAVAIAVASIPALVWVAARVYERGILHTGGRMKLTEALKG